MEDKLLDAVAEHIYERLVEEYGEDEAKATIAKDRSQLLIVAVAVVAAQVAKGRPEPSEEKLRSMLRGHGEAVSDEDLNCAMENWKTTFFDFVRAGGMEPYCPGYAVH